MEISSEVRPKLLVSRCFFEAVRYDGGKIKDDLMDKLSRCCDVEMVCPEVGMGLPVPREPIDLFLVNGEVRLMNKSRTEDLTERMRTFASAFLESLKKDEPDGIVLKAKSPSCGFRDAKLFHLKGNVVSRTNGAFASKVLEALPDIPLESERRLTNARIRFDFFSTVFALARYRKVVKKKDLVEFHRRYKFLLLAKNEKIAREMGKLVAEKGFSVEQRNLYRTLLLKALMTPFKKSRVINAILHIYGFLKNHIGKEEKAYFIDLLESYAEGHVSLQTIIAVLKAWALSYNVEYIKDQMFLEPYPKVLEIENQHL